MFFVCEIYLHSSWIHRSKPKIYFCLNLVKVNSSGKIFNSMLVSMSQLQSAWVSSNKHQSAPVIISNSATRAFSCFWNLIWTAFWTNWNHIFIESTVASSCKAEWFLFQKLLDINKLLYFQLLFDSSNQIWQRLKLGVLSSKTIKTIFDWSNLNLT